MTTQLRVLWAEQSFSFSSLMRSLVSCFSSILFLFTIIVAISVNFMGTCKLITRAFQVTNLFIPLNGKDLSNYHYICYTCIRPVLHIKGSTTTKKTPHQALNYIFETADTRPFLFLPMCFRTNTKKALLLNLIYTSFDSR